MKQMCVIAALAVPLLLTSCKKPVAEEEPAAPQEERPVVTATPAPKKVEATPAPVVSATPPPATPAPELAPPGVFYLIAAVRVETPDGIQGLTPGTGVKLVRPGIYLTPAGEAPLREDQLTNDMALARRAMQADRATQTAMKQQSAMAVAKSAQATTKALEDGAAGHKAALAQIDRQQLTGQLANLMSLRQGVESQINTLSAKRSKESYNEYVKGRTVTSTTETSLKAARAQLDALNSQINDVERALSKLNQ